MVIDIIKGIFSIFIHPLLYIFILAAFLFGYQRVRRERLSFGVKVFGIVDHFGKSIIPSFLIGLSGSVVMLGLGITLPYGFLYLITLCYLLLFLTGQLRYITASVAVGFAIFITYFLPDIKTNTTLLNDALFDLHHTSFRAAGTLLVVTLLMETLLIALWGAKQSSPRLINSKRGKKVGSHEANQLWIAPLFMLIPVASHISRVGWWPLTYTHLNHFSLLLVPFGIGFQQLISHTHPKKGVAVSSKWLSVTTLGIAIMVGLDWWLDMPMLVAIGGCVAVLSRLAMVLYHQYSFDAKPFYLNQRNDGLIIVGVIPDSPAYSMGLKIGERVVKVNDKKVSSELEFYEAIQTNAAYCKLDVFNADNEVRFVNGPIYEGDYHTIGLLFLEPSKRVPHREAK